MPRKSSNSPRTLPPIANAPRPSTSSTTSTNVNRRESIAHNRSDISQEKQPTPAQPAQNRLSPQSQREATQHKNHSQSQVPPRRLPPMEQKPTERPMTPRTQAQGELAIIKGGGQMLEGGTAMAAGATGIPLAETIATKAVKKGYEAATKSRKESLLISQTERQREVDGSDGRPVTPGQAKRTEKQTGGYLSRNLHQLKERMDPRVAKEDRQNAARDAKGIREHRKDNLSQNPTAKRANTVAKTAEKVATVAGAAGTVSTVATFTGVGAPMGVTATAAANTAKNVANVAAGGANIVKGRALLDPKKYTNKSSEEPNPLDKPPLPPIKKDST